MLMKNVQLLIQDDVVIWKNNNCRIVCKVNSPSMLKSIKRLKQGPVPRDIFSPNETIQELLRRGMLVEGDNEEQLQGIIQHYNASPPFNKGKAYTNKQLLAMQDHAKNRRFSSKDLSICSFEVPLALHRYPSMSTSITEDQLAALDSKLLEKLLYTLYDNQNHLYPSAGALYPIQIYIEQHENNEVKLIKFNTTTGCIEYKTLTSEKDQVSLDPMLAKTQSKIWLCADLKDITYKYGERGYRFALLEAGHAAQVIIQLLNNNGISCRPFGGFDDQKAQKYLGLPFGEVVTYVLGAYQIKLPNKADRWIIAEDMRYALINNIPVHYATTYGGYDTKGNPIYGYGTDRNSDYARLKSQAELAERIALVNGPKNLVNSNGMAAHTRFESAVRNAVLELYERHCVLRTWHKKESTNAVKIPSNEVGLTVNAMTKLTNTKIIIKDITDPLYAIPCFMAVIYAAGHGGILTSSSAGLTGKEAMNKTLWEIVKSLFYRTIIRNEPIFPANDSISAIVYPEDHEMWYARSNMSIDNTNFLVKSTEERDLSNNYHSLDILLAVTEILDLSHHGPDANRWKIAKAYSDNLLVLDFGKPSKQYWNRLYQIIGQVKNHLIHPIG